MTAALPPPPPPSTAPGAAGLGQSLTLSAPCELLSGPNSNVTSVVETSLIQVYRVTFKNHFHEQVFVFSCVSSFDHSLMQCIFFFLHLPVQGQACCQVLGAQTWIKCRLSLKGAYGRQWNQMPGWWWSETGAHTSRERAWGEGSPREKMLDLPHRCHVTQWLYEDVTRPQRCVRGKQWKSTGSLSSP